MRTTSEILADFVVAVILIAVIACLTYGVF